MGTKHRQRFLLCFLFTFRLDYILKSFFFAVFFSRCPKIFNLYFFSRFFFRDRISGIFIFFRDFFLPVLPLENHGNLAPAGRQKNFFSPFAIDIRQSLFFFAVRDRRPPIFIFFRGSRSAKNLY